MAWTYKRRGKGRGDDEEKLPKKNYGKKNLGQKEVMKKFRTLQTA